ncbi:MAG: Fe-S cluster protein [Desulfatitalea sp.]|nr:Fe-S cluster protein [Desulfatitalea sp.]NNJ99820.1 Fe-S cluster protein [Desulfatitalea sp.]
MILKGYTKKIFNSECNPACEGVHCIAKLDQDIAEVLPYLSAALGGYEYLNNPPAVTFKAHGKPIAVQASQIAINALRSEAEADKILSWLQREINEAWENRSRIEPCYEGAPKPNLIEVLKHLPKTNCQKCNQPTCMVFAVRITEGNLAADDCPILDKEQGNRIGEYMGRFDMEKYYSWLRP